MRIDEKMVEAAVSGGAILGGGGGGWIDEGLRLGHFAWKSGFRDIRSIETVADDAMLLTVSGVGAPSAGSHALAPEDYVRAVELFLEKTRARVSGFISSEVGALGVVNGWVQSAALQIPVVDAPANGRAHPLGLMGSMGLHRLADYVSRQTAVGGKREGGNRVEAFFEGPLAEVSAKVREVAVNAGGMVAVARNLISAGYVRKNGAPGAITMARQLGDIWLERRKAGPKGTLKAIYDFLGAGFMVEARVDEITLRTEGGLDVGMIHLRTPIDSYELTFWNEYMTLERNRRRLATFPDLIVTFDANTATPLISVQIKEGQDAAVIAVPAARLILGEGMRDDLLLGQVEVAIGKEIARFRR